MEIFFIVIGVIVFIIFIVNISSVKLVKEGDLSEDEDHLPTLITIISEEEKLLKQVKEEIQSCLSDQSGLSSDDLQLLQNAQEHLSLVLTAAQDNQTTFESMLPKDENHVVKVKEFDETRSTFMDQYVNAVTFYMDIMSISIRYRHKNQQQDLLVEQGKILLESIMRYLSILQIAYDTDTESFDSEARSYLELSLIDIALVDEELSKPEVHFLNSLFDKQLTAEEYKQYYNKETSEQVIKSTLSTFSTNLKKYSKELAQEFDSTAHHLLLCMIAVDSEKDDKEISKLQEYFDLPPEKNSSLSSHKMLDTVPEKDSQTLVKLLDELNKLIGLDAVKQEINNFINLVQVNTLRANANLPENSLSMHLVFTGNPGTGKTTVARLLARILRKLGLLSKGHLVEVARADLVGGYVGQTAIKTQEVIDKSMGGIMFIDEAYSLAVNATDADYGREAIETLLKAMEDHRDNLIVIVAGYPQEMSRFILSNPGLQSRFSKYVEFPDYNAEELMQIMLKITDESSYTLEPRAEDIIRTSIEQLFDNKTKYFGNARAIRNLFEHVIQQHSNRIMTLDNPGTDELQTITQEDLLGLIHDEKEQFAEA